MLGSSAIVLRAAVRKKIVGHAAAMLRCGEDELELVPGGIVRVIGKNLSVLFFDVALRSHFGVGGPIIGEHALVYDGEPFDHKRSTIAGFPIGNLGIFMFGAQAVEVEIDEDTGKATPLAHDVGRAINPLAVEGQIQGGSCKGWAMR